MDLPDDFIVFVEKQVIRIVIDVLKSRSATVEQSKVVLREFLKLTPFSTLEDMKAKILNFSKVYPVFQPVYITVLKYEDDYEKDHLINKMRKLIKEQDVDGALEVVKK